MKVVGLLLFLTLLTGLCCGTTLRVKHSSSLSSSNHVSLLSKLQASSDYDYKIDRTTGSVQIFLSLEEFSSLQAEFPTLQIVEKSQPLRSKLQQQQVPPGGYLDLAGLWAALETLVKENPTILKFVNLTAFGPGRTFEGREMPMVKLSDNVEKDEDEPNILIVASHHAREIVNPHIALDLLNRLINGYKANDTRLSAIVNGNEIFVSPVWNPDGYNHVWEVDDFWRKNRKPVSNTFGVDQNRNYPYGWGTSCSGSSIPSSETYKGPSAASEEETQIIINFSKARNFAKVQDFHSYGREVLFSFVCDPFPQNLDNYIAAEASKLAALTTTRYATRKPSGDGQHQEWHIKEESAYSFLTETQLDFQPSYQEAQKEFDILWPMNLFFLERSIPYSGHVFSATGAPIQASISIQQVPNVYWKSNARFGSYHFFLPDGQYTVTFSATGYQPVTRTIQISNASPLANQDLILQLA